MTSSSAATNRQTTFGRLADLPLRIESYALDGLQRHWSAEFVRHTTVVRLSGAGETGVGEDVTYTPDDHEVLQAAGPSLWLAGRYTLESFSRRLDELELFPVPPFRADSRNTAAGRSRARRWTSRCVNLACPWSPRSIGGLLR